MVEVDEFNIKSALEWVNTLTASGTTNTLGAIRFAFDDLNIEAIYLLSDGRPDQVNFLHLFPNFIVIEKIKFKGSATNFIPKYISIQKFQFIQFLFITG